MNGLESLFIKMIKKLFLIIMVSVWTINVYADTYTITTGEQQKMIDEADDWIDNIPEGLQDRLADAVLHAQKGFWNEIQYVRNLKDTVNIGSYKVNITDLKGSKGLDIPMRLYSAGKDKDKKLPLLVYFHGGGWSFGSIDLTDKFCRALAAEGNVRILSVEYPLSPEKEYPSALNVCKNAVEYITENLGEIIGTTNALSLGGDGAGGNLALQTYFALPESVHVNSLVLYYPMLVTTGKLDVESKRKYGRGYGFDSRLWETFIQAYNGKDSLKEKKLPKTLLITAGRDILIKQEKDFHTQHPSINYVEFTGAIHGFITDGKQNTAFNKAVQITDNFLK